MNSSLRPNWRTFFNTRRLAVFFAFLAIIALIFMSAITYAQWQQLKTQQLYSSIYITREPRILTEVQRELLRFHGVIATFDGEEDADRVALHRNLVKGRYTALTRSLSKKDGLNDMTPLAKSLRAEWLILQPLIDEWVVTKDKVLFGKIETELMRMEGLINGMIAEEVHLSYRRSGDFSDVIRRNMASMLVGMVGFMLFLFLFSIGVILSLRRSALSQEALRSNERQLRATLDTIPDAVARITRGGVVTSFHPGKVSILPDLPMEEEAFAGCHISEVFPPQLEKKILEGITQALGEDSVQQFEFNIPLPDQNEFEQQIFEVRIIPIGGDEVQGMLRDVTAARQRKEAAYQGQKLESLGLLAGGIAHDFNNILAGIMGQASLAQTREKRGHSPAKHIDKIIVAAQRAADLTRQLLSYAGKGQFSVELFDVNQLINDDRMFLETVSRKGVELEFELAEYNIPIKADKGQIQQILLNLIINAGDAIGSQVGRVTVRAGVEMVYAAEKLELWSKEKPFVPGKYAFFDVEDNGSGMSAEVMGKIFDPFFTTKPTGHGLGLSGTLGVVHRHGGGVRVHSVDGRGSRFTVLFPLAKETAAQAAQSTDMQRELGTILIADDDREVRELLTTILTDAGANVLVAADGREAVTLFMQHDPQIDLIILDMMMPEMNGDEVYDQISCTGSDVLVLISSGYGDTAALDTLVTKPKVALLPKPYHANELLLKIQELMNKRNTTVMASLNSISRYPEPTNTPVSYSCILFHRGWVPPRRLRYPDGIVYK